MQSARSLFVSDLHLGTRECQAERLLALLTHYRVHSLYLLGDVIDLWAMARRVHWPQAQNAVIQQILLAAQRGVAVTFVPGNHDAPLRDYDGMSLGEIHIQREAVHVAADGRRYLLVHGDCFDDQTRYHRWVAWAGDAGYSSLMIASRMVSQIRRRLGREDHWSLAGAIKRRLPSAVAYVETFERAAAQRAAALGFDGVVCGHIHVPAVKHIEGVAYHNCGDWVDSASAVMEHHDGRMELCYPPLLARAQGRIVPHAA